MADDTKFICKKCGKPMNELQFYTYKDGTKTELCKKCLTMHVDCFNPETFLWLLEKMDVPYVPEEWNILRDRDYAKDPTKFNNTAVFGKYLSKMKLKQWKKYGWEDSEKLQCKRAERTEAEKEAQAKFEQEIQEKYDKGEISEAEYRTLMSTEAQNEANGFIGPTPQSIGMNNSYNENVFMSEDELINPAADLTDEDKLYLAMKWGRLYKPNEWVELEKKYNEMMSSFDIQDSDTIGTLILICKTYLKMNQAIDCGDTQGYQQLARVYDTLRKSSKFTAAQNKGESSGFVDSVGQMVAYCEKEGGQIPKFEIKSDLDIVDTVIRDLKDYTKSLIYEDASLGRQIEDYLKKKEISEISKKEKEEARKLGVEYELDDEDMQDYNNLINEQKAQDLQTLYDSEVTGEE